MSRLLATPTLTNTVVTLDLPLGIVSQIRYRPLDDSEGEHLDNNFCIAQRKAVAL